MHPESSHIRADGGDAAHLRGGAPRVVGVARRRGRRRVPPGPLVALLALASLTWGCGGPPETGDGAESGASGAGGAGGAAVEVVDGAGRPVRLDAPARRVVSMIPALTEWIVAMGAGDRLVARTDYDTDPSLAGLPSVGGGLDPSVEWLAARRPDLVLAWPDAPSRSLVSRLEALGIPAYTAPIETIDEALAAARDLGRLLGDSASAAAAIGEVRAGLDAVSARVAGTDRPSVLFLIGLDPLMAAGPGTFLHELVERAGGRSAIADVGILWPQLSLEEVVRRAPDVVIVGSVAVTDPAATLAGRPGWREVPAVRTGRVHAVDPDVVNRPGPGLDEAAALLARLIHASPSPAAPSAGPDGP